MKLEKLLFRKVELNISIFNDLKKVKMWVKQSIILNMKYKYSVFIFIYIATKENTQI